ncbi:hypothetical protein D3Z62_24150 [Lachnospiraceae bacterium]|nr:hypothetical protein [Lachnospiraceae bacterium]
MFCASVEKTAQAKNRLQFVLLDECRTQICFMLRTLKIVYLPRQPGDVLPPVSSLVGKGGAYAMSTYEEL